MLPKKRFSHHKDNKDQNRRKTSDMVLRNRVLGLGKKTDFQYKINPNQFNPAVKKGDNTQFKYKQLILPPPRGLTGTPSLFGLNPRVLLAPTIFTGVYIVLVFSLISSFVFRSWCWSSLACFPESLLIQHGDQHWVTEQQHHGDTDQQQQPYHPPDRDFQCSC